jgi:hypothetical protein
MTELAGSSIPSKRRWLFEATNTMWVASRRSSQSTQRCGSCWCTCQISGMPLARAARPQARALDSSCT